MLLLLVGLGLGAVSPITSNLATVGVVAQLAGVAGAVLNTAPGMPQAEPRTALECGGRRP